MLSPRASILRRLGLALEAAGILGFLVSAAASTWRTWPMSLVPEETSGLHMLFFALLGATGAVLGSKAAKVR